MENQVNFAIVGCGTITKKHIDAINNVSNAKLVALYSRNKEKAKQWGNDYRVQFYSDYEEMITSDTIDAVVILSPSGLHAEYGIAAAKAGKHVLVEKPIDTTIAKATSLIQACEQANVTLSSIFQHRFDEAIIRLKRAVEDNLLGQLHLGVSRNTLYRSEDYYASGKWRGTLELDGGGALMNQGIHYIDLLLYIMGPVEEVHGYCVTRAHDNIEVEDVAAASLKFKSGAVGMIEGTTAAFPGYSSSLDIFGKNGSVRIDADKIKNWDIKNQDGDVPSLPPQNEDKKTMSLQAFTRQYEDFVASILKNRKPLVDGYEAMKALQVILAIYESSKTGQPVKL